ncbi:hypothetical protein B0J12DRAFT_594604 [Macrophomina phaseolina]|uniref:RBR-type E3 ubiquitin transferase n=1 Tax=Macrophomina phaseolina TaxID=35725 RepID=A0ABQ8GKF6_9PEZI|nr:hypothetical protein B0J12DRAFT_594604 [Macrophomina phaseolina]
MATQSSPNLLTWLTTGLQQDRPALFVDDEKQPVSTSSSLDLERYHIPGAYQDPLVGTSTSNDFKTILSTWANKLRPSPKCANSQPSLGPVSQDALSPCHELALSPQSLALREHVRKPSSYEEYDDNITTVERNHGHVDDTLSIEAHRIPFTNHHIQEECPAQNDADSMAHHRASYPYQADGKTQLSFDENEVFTVSRKVSNGWWYGSRLSSGESGWIPSPYFGPVIDHCHPQTGRLPKRQRAIRGKKSVGRAPTPTPTGPDGDAVQFYKRFSNILLSYGDCVVCGESKPYTEFPDSTVLQCQHQWTICKDCVRHWVAVELDGKGWDYIKCPEFGCTTSLNHSDMSRLADSATFERYDALAFRAYLSKDSNFRWCLSPVCQSGQIHDGDSGPIFKCIGCGAQFCMHHEMPWHRGQTCQQYNQRVTEKRDREKRATEKIIARTTKKCPGKGCEWMIEKNNGCDHMTCRQCKHEFCWICLAAYDPIRRHGNGMHRTSCKYHSANVR